MTVLGATCASCKAVNPRAARFCISCGHRLAEAAPPESAFPAERSAIERRRITVVFCDLVGSSALATAMDPEDYTELIGTVLRGVSEVVERFGGFVAHYLGDGTLSYFGYPSANEDDTERAVHAALAMSDAVSAVALPDGRQLAARVGVAAGEVVVGDIIGLRSPRGMEMAGALPNLAARLQSVAEAGTVLVDETVFRTVGRLFECRNLGDRELKGWSDAVPVWQVLRPAENSDRFEARAASGLAPLVGRTAEAALLVSLWEKARAGRGCIVLLSGDPGIGKSRLVADLLQRTAGESHTRLRYACSALQQGVPLAPCIRGIERGAGLTQDDGPETKRAKLRTVVGVAGEPAFELICNLLAVPPAQPAAAAQLSPQKQRERTIAALIAVVARLSERRPVLAVFEDAHWSDPTSAEMLAVAAREIGRCRVLMVVTARPEFDPSWAKHEDAEVIELNPLSAVESRELVGWVAGEAQLTREAIRDIAARSDGVPLFLEEVTKAVLEAGAAASATPRRPRNTPSVPEAIHSSLLARLDRLGGAREVAEVAATIGREFSLELLARVTGRSEAALSLALARLTGSGLVVACSPDRRQFRFKHALIQDAAYGIIVRGQRRILHARIAHALEAHFPKLAAAEPQLLAHHCTEAGFGEKAAAWWLRAGNQSLMRSATSEALVQIARGLDAIQALPVTRAREQQELDLRLAYGKALVATHGHAAPSTKETFAIARDLCERLGGRPPQLLTVLHSQWSHALVGADLRSAKRQAEEILQSAEDGQDSMRRLLGFYALGMSSMPLGLFHGVLGYLRRFLAMVAALGPAAGAGPFASDLVVVSRTYLCHTLLCLGHLDEARRECRAAFADARRLGLAFTVAHALWIEAYLTLNTAGAEAALSLFEKLRRLAGEQGIAFFDSMAAAFQGWSQAMLGDYAGGLALLREGRDLYVGASNLLYVPTLTRMEAEILGRAGRPEEGLRVLAGGVRLKDETGALWDEAEFERTRAELLWACDRPCDAERACREAIRLACARSARVFELRSAIVLADRLAAAGRGTEAASQLTPICAWFEGQGTSRELMQARHMLDALAAGPSTHRPRAVVRGGE